MDDKLNDAELRSIRAIQAVLERLRRRKPMSDTMPEEIYAFDADELENRRNWIVSKKHANYVRKDLIPEWNDDMDAAPRDGTEIDILLNGKSRVPDVHWSWKYSDGFQDKDWVEVGTGNPVLFDDMNKITHWMPLPKPPQTGGEG